MKRKGIGRQGKARTEIERKQKEHKMIEKGKDTLTKQTRKYNKIKGNKDMPIKEKRQDKCKNKGQIREKGKGKGKGRQGKGREGEEI